MKEESKDTTIVIEEQIFKGADDVQRNHSLRYCLRQAKEYV